MKIEHLTALTNSQKQVLKEKDEQNEKLILKVDNFSLVSKELKAKDGSCKRQYLEYLLPDKKTHIIGRTAHITPRIL